MEEFFLIQGKRLVKGISPGYNGSFFLALTAYEYIEGSWEEINVNEVNDRLMGYESTEDCKLYKIGNTEVSDEIVHISEVDINKFM